MRKINTSHLKRDKIIFFLWPVVAAAISFAVNAKFFTSLVLFFGLPVIFLCIKNKRKIHKALLFSAVSFVIVIFVDYICDITGTWLIVKSVINYRFLGQVTLENFIWMPLWTFFIVMYYEYFIENGERDVLYKPRLKYLYVLFASFLMIFFTVYLVNKDWLYIKYFYLKFGTALVFAPVTFTLFKFPKLFIKFLKAGIYFFYISLVYELTALSLDQWVFPGKEIVGLVTIGKVSFPVEELFFWIMLGAVALLSYYEFFDDDCK